MDQPVEKAKAEGAQADAAGPSQWHLKLSFATLLSIAAFGLSLISLYFSYTSGVDSAHIEALKTEHGLFTDLGRMQIDHPLMAHLFAYTPEQYDNASRKVGQISQSLQPQEKLKYLMEEQGIAHYFFTLFEETYFYWDHAKESGNRTRAELLDGDLNWFSRQICNPRLAWYWDPDKGVRLALNFSTELQSYVEEKMKKRKCVARDAKGPLG